MPNNGNIGKSIIACQVYFFNYKIHCCKNLCEDNILRIYDIIFFYLENSAKSAYLKISYFGTAEK
jgi:hypothetical protein